MTLDPQARWVLDLVQTSGRPTLDSLSPVEARQQFDETLPALDAKPVPMAEVRDFVAAGPHGPIPLRFYRPAQAGAAPGPLLVYYHGGGWVIGGIASYDSMCRALAHKAGCRVISVDYRLAPEHKFPIAVEDAFAALRWIAAHAADLGVDPRRIAVGGDSAGGNLSAVMTQLAQATGGPALRFQLLIYPATDMQGGTASHRDFADGYLLSSQLMRWFVGHYLRDEADAADHRASPLLAPSLRGLPPAFIVTAGFDPLQDEGKAYADRLAEAGVPVRLSHYPGMIHGFFNMSGALAEAQRGIDEAAAALAAALDIG